MSLLKTMPRKGQKRFKLKPPLMWCTICRRPVVVYPDRPHEQHFPPRRPDKSHRMTTWRTEIRCPGSTPRFYGVRECRKCGQEELKHPAGHFLNSLEKPCSGKRQD